MMKTVEMRAEVQRVFHAGVVAADPKAAVLRALKHDPLAQGPVTIIAVGKAAHAMCSAAMQVAQNVTEAIVVTNPENAQPLDGARVFAAAHPVPDTVGKVAAQEVIAALNRAKGQVLALISGGGSALLPAPAGDITLADKAQVNALLLASGAPIEHMNLIRQQLSDLKGGGMFRHAQGVPLRALILSDVIGDDLRAIASGPTTDPLGTAQDAVALLKIYEIWGQVAAPVSAHLAQERPTPAPVIAKNTLIGSNPISVAAMHRAAGNAMVMRRPLIGDVAAAAAQVVQFATVAGTYLMGGETTVFLTGTGRGGRNQDLALRVALLAEQADWTGPWVYLQGGTDGRDGPTDAAGGLVDHGTLARIRAAGIDPVGLLENNDSYAALSAADDLLMTGATGTNVADLGVLIRG
jgi:hydroxypyruvate reductase